MGGGGSIHSPFVTEYLQVPCAGMDGFSTIPALPELRKLSGHRRVMTQCRGRSWKKYTGVPETHQEGLLTECGGSGRVCGVVTRNQSLRMMGVFTLKIKQLIISIGKKMGLFRNNTELQSGTCKLWQKTYINPTNKQTNKHKVEAGRGWF